MPINLASLVCIDDFEAIAKTKLPKFVYDYYRSGADDQLTLRRNVQAFKNYLIRPRMLRNVSNISTKVTVLGDMELSSPIGIAPTAFQKMADPLGEVATVRAAEKLGAVMINSTIATTSLEEVAEAGWDAMRWFQLYVYKDRDATRRLVKRAEAAGFKALVLTIDTPVLGHRRDDARNAFALPSHLQFGNFDNTDKKAVMQETEIGQSAFQTYVQSLFDVSLTWTDVAWLVQLTSLPVVVKGILTAQDALLAYQHGAKGVIVSNHGARQLDSVPSTIEALPEIASALKGRCDVFLDGGVRCGTDVLKALALGAKAVFVGRPVVWGLAVQGEAGVTRALQILQSELESAMALAGCRAIDEITPSLVVHESFYSKL